MEIVGARLGLLGKTKYRANRFTDAPAQVEHWRRETEAHSLGRCMAALAAMGEAFMVHADEADLRWGYDLVAAEGVLLPPIAALGASYDVLAGNLALRLGLVDEAEQ